MRCKNIFKSKISLIVICVFIYVLFYIVDLSQINYKYINKKLVTFDNKSLSFNLNKKIYFFYNNFFSEKKYIKDNQDRSKLNKKFIINSSPKTEKKYSYQKLLGNWPRSHGNNYSNKFSNLKKINKENIKNLDLAWIYNSNNNKGTNIDIQCNPIAVNGIIYTPVIGGFIVAIDGSNGKELWRSEKLNNDVARRGLLYWEDTKNNVGKIFFNNGSKLFALNAKNGKKIISFGHNGYTRTGYSKITPIIYKKNIVIASWKKDLEVYDIYSGKLKWKYHFGDKKRLRIGKILYDNLKGGNPWWNFIR